MKKRAGVQLSLEALQAILHLREGVAVTGASYNAMTETLTLFLAGEEFPPVHKREHARMYPLAELMEDFH